MVRWEWVLVTLFIGVPTVESLGESVLDEDLQKGDLNSARLKKYRRGGEDPLSQQGSNPTKDYRCRFTTYVSKGAGDITQPSFSVPPGGPRSPSPSRKGRRVNGVEFRFTRTQGLFKIDGIKDGRTLWVATTQDGFPLGLQIPKHKVIVSCDPHFRGIQEACRAKQNVMGRKLLLNPNSGVHGGNETK